MPYKREDIEPIGEKDWRKGRLQYRPLSVGLGAFGRDGTEVTVTRVTPPVLGVPLLFSLVRSNYRPTNPHNPRKKQGKCVLIERAGLRELLDEVQSKRDICGREMETPSSFVRSCSPFPPCQ